LFIFSNNKLFGQDRKVVIAPPNCREMISLSQLLISSESIVQLGKMLNDDDWMWLALLSSRTGRPDPSVSGGIRWYPVSRSGIRRYPVVSSGIRRYPAASASVRSLSRTAIVAILAYQKQKKTSRLLNNVRMYGKCKCENVSLNVFGASFLFFGRR
jgi:hypothetical protein